MIKGPVTRAAWAAELLKSATIFKPPGPGPFPVSIQLHGCGGPREFLRAYAEAACAAGVAVVNVDSYTARGISRLRASALICTGVMLKGDQRASDVYALYHWARHEDWIDPERIALSGWSHGAWTIMDALAMDHDQARRITRLTDLPANPLDGLAAAILVYTYAGFPSLTTRRGWAQHPRRVSALICGKDAVVGHQLPTRAFDRLERDGVPVDRLFMPEATHAFDDDKPSDPRTKYRPDLLDQAKGWYGDQLRLAFADRG